MYLMKVKVWFTCLRVKKIKKCFSWWRVSGRRDVLVQGLQHFRWKCPTRVETGVVIIEKHAKSFLCQGLSKGPPVALLLLALQHLHLAPGPHIQLHHWGIRISASHPGVHTFNTILEVKPSLVSWWWLYPSFWHWWSRLFLLFLFVRSLTISQHYRWCFVCSRRQTYKVLLRWRCSSKTVPKSRVF